MAKQKTEIIKTLTPSEDITLPLSDEIIKRLEEIKRLSAIHRAEMFKLMHHSEQLKTKAVELQLKAEEHRRQVTEANSLKVGLLQGFVSGKGEAMGLDYHLNEKEDALTYKK